MIIKKRTVGKHKGGCFAVENVELGEWKTPWSGCVRTVFRDGTGGNRGKTTVWTEVLCNDPNCKAVLLLCTDDILAAAGECKQ